MTHELPVKELEDSELDELYRLCDDLEKQPPDMLMSLPSLPEFIRTLHSEVTAIRSGKAASSSREPPTPVTPPSKARAKVQVDTRSLKRERPDGQDCDHTPTKKRRAT